MGDEDDVAGDDDDEVGNDDTLGNCNEENLKIFVNESLTKGKILQLLVPIFNCALYSYPKFFGNKVI